MDIRLVSLLVLDRVLDLDCRLTELRLAVLHPSVRGCDWYRGLGVRQFRWHPVDRDEELSLLGVDLCRVLE